MEEEIPCQDTSSVITKQTQAFTIDFGEPKNNQEHIKALQRSSQRRISSLHSNNFKNESEIKEESEPTSEELALVENKGDKDILTKLDGLEIESQSKNEDSLSYTGTYTKNGETEVEVSKLASKNN